MKIRNGFVSNSSTSSFIVAGFYIPKRMTITNILEKLYGYEKDFPKKETFTDMDEYEEKVSEWDECFYNDGDIKYISSEKFIGISLASGSSDGDIGSSFLKEIVDETEKLREKLGFSEKEEVVILSGIEAC